MRSIRCSRSPGAALTCSALREAEHLASSALQKPSRLVARRVTARQGPHYRAGCRRRQQRGLLLDVQPAPGGGQPTADDGTVRTGRHRATQAVLQGAFILAKATNDPAAATDNIDHLPRYLTHHLRPAPMREMIDVAAIRR